jgi:hypothetical protein
LFDDLLADAFSEFALLDDFDVAAFSDAESDADLLVEAFSESDVDADLLAEVFSELELEDDLLAEAFSAALAAFESLAERPEFDELLLFEAEFEAELELLDAVPEVVLVAFVEEPSEAVRLLAVVPLEAELSPPLVPLLL